MDLIIGSVLDGKVTRITKFGAFVSIADGKSGMVHISEISNSYVNEVSDFLTEGQEVRVKVMKIDDEGRINLSIKKAQQNNETVNPAQRFEKRPNNYKNNEYKNFNDKPREQNFKKPAKTKMDPADMSFEDKLKLFMQDSQTNLSAIKNNTDRKNGTRRKK